MKNTLPQSTFRIPSNKEWQKSRNDFFIKLSEELEASFGLSLGEVFSPDEISNISLVYSLADLMHHDQKRKTWNQRGYIEHIQDVALLVIENSVWNLNIKTLVWKEKLKKRLIIALLHDLIEDTWVSQEVIWYLFWEDIAF